MDKSAEHYALEARMEDLCAKAEKGEVALSDFLSPSDRQLAAAHLGSLGARMILYGGYEDAERQRIYILPDYMEGVRDICELCEYGADICISALLVLPSGFSRRLTHRDFLGAVLNTGLDRAVIGDILVDEDGTAVIFCDSAITEFLLAELTRVANDKVKVSEVSLDEVTVPERKFADINDTVASPRLDCVVGALCSLSRDKAKAAVLSGLVELDFIPESRPDREVREGANVSVRGNGRYRVVTLSDKTRKGRYRLFAQKYL